MIRLEEARRIALAAAGFDKPRPAKPDARAITSAIRRLGLVQIDSVNFLVRAHYLVLFARLGPYSRDRFDEIVYGSGQFTEQWAHEASIVPIELWPVLRHRRAAFVCRPAMVAPFLEAQREYVEWVLAEVGRRGPLVAADLPHPPAPKGEIAPPWFGSANRIVLETLFGRGALAVHERRSNYARAFDLAARVIPRELQEQKMSPEECGRELIRIAARNHGIATAADLADYFRMPPKEAQARIAELTAGGELEPASVEGWKQPAYLDPQAARPRKIEAASVLSPFDPLVWFRPRLERLFQFDYRIEIYTPAHKRTFGYYTLPVLAGERLVARVDLKADRREKRLALLSCHREHGVTAAAVEGALIGELRELARWLDLEPPDSAKPSSPKSKGK